MRLFELQVEIATFFRINLFFFLDKLFFIGMTDIVVI